MKTVLTVSLVLATILLGNTVHAKAKIPFGKMEVLTLQADLPDNEEYMLDNGQYLDLATLHEEFNVAWILPLWITKEPKLVGYDQVTDLYYDLSVAEMDAILKENNLKKDDLMSIGFYKRYGGKLILLSIIGLVIYGFVKRK